MIEIIFTIIITFIIGFVIGYIVHKPKADTQSTSSSSISPLSNSLARMILASTDSNTEYFDSSLEQSIQKISRLIDDGNLEEVERVIIAESDSSIGDIINEINNSSEILKPELIKDPDLIEAVDIIDTQGDIAQIQDEIEDQMMVQELVESSSKKNIIQNKIDELHNKLNILHAKLLSKPPIENAINRISDPIKLAHLQEVQAKILSKREIQNKKQEDKIKKDNPEIKGRIERIIATKKVVDVEEQKKKIKEDSSTSRRRR
jgi:hypothetical protein